MNTTHSAETHGVDTMTDTMTDTMSDTVTGTTATTMKLTCINFNCKDFCSSAEYIACLAKKCDILCLSETWLRPENLHVIDSVLQNTLDSDFQVFAKSSMNDLDGAHRGRPFGGMAVICKRKPGLLFNELEVDCVRAINVCDDAGNVIHLVLSVYLPFYCADNTDDFIHTLDHIQALIDNRPNNCPIKMMGDFNVQLPSLSRLAPRWERAAGFNPHSKLMYDFLCANDLVTCDLFCQQPVRYTYFCLSRCNISCIYLL